MLSRAASTWILNAKKKSFYRWKIMIQSGNFDDFYYESALNWLFSESTDNVVELDISSNYWDICLFFVEIMKVGAK